MVGPTHAEMRRAGVALIERSFELGVLDDAVGRLADSAGGVVILEAAAGKTNRAIAHELFLSTKTVETHLAAGFRKLGVNARADLAAGLAR